VEKDLAAVTSAGRPITASFALAVVLCAHRARGDEGAVSLTWTAPAGCPTQAEVLEQIRNVVGSPVNARDPVEARAVLVPGERETWKGTLELSVGGQTSTRQVEGETCRAVADAVVVMVALAANPDALRAPPAEPPAPPPAPAPLSAAPAVPPSATPPARESPVSRSTPAGRRPIALGASFLVAAGSLPGIAPGAEATLGWNPSRFGLEANGAFLATQRALLATRPEGATFWLAHLGARACYEVVRGALDVAPCGGGGAEWTFAQGTGATVPANATGRAAMVSLGGRALAHLTAHIVLRVAVEAALPLARPRFVIHGVDGDETVYQASAIQGRATAGAEIYF
jgi:hypothetical protein